MHPAALELKKQLQSRYGERLARFIVFGSHARGDHTYESDIDVMVSLHGDVTWETKYEVWDISLDVSLHHDVVLDVKILSEYDIQHTIIGASPFVESVLEEGIAI